MKRLTASLAKSQLKRGRRRTFWTLLGIIFSTALITAVFGVAASGISWVERVADSPETLIYNGIVMGMGSVVNLLVVGISVVVVSNSFRVSAGERTGQFGILKSVGATKKQITQTVVYEGVYLLILGVPIGILLGIAFQWGGLWLANDILGDMQENFRRDISIPFVVSWWAILTSALLSGLTVLYSAWRPARKAAKIPAIDAIRQRDVASNGARGRKTRDNPIVRTLFGFEGALAAKSLKRSRRNFRATVVSLACSMVLFIGAGAFGLQMQNLAANDWMRGIRANVTVNNFPQVHTPSALSFERAAQLHEYFGQYGNVTMLANYGVSFIVEIQPEERTPEGSPLLDEAFVPIETRDRPGFRWVSLVALDDETYKRVSELANVPLGSNILVNFERQWNDEGTQITDVEPWVFSGQAWEIAGVAYHDDRDEVLPPERIELHGVLRAEDVLPEIVSRMGDSMIIVPQDSEFFAVEDDAGFSFNWFVEARNSEEFQAAAHAKIEPLQNGEHGTFGVWNLQVQRDQEEAIVRVIMTAAYLFIAMLTLIGLTNVISTISTNVRARAKEFAMLESVGMTKKGISRMLRLESLLCSLRAVCFGIPLGLLLSYVTHQIVASADTWRFDVPWMIVLQCVIGIFVLTFVIMQVVSRKTRSGSIVEVVRGEG